MHTTDLRAARQRAARLIPPDGAGRRRLGALALAVLLASAATVGHGAGRGHGIDADVGRMTGEQLKRAYLACDRASRAATLGSGEVWRCSTIYESLKRRVFEGDFDRLRAWSRSPQGEGPSGEGPAHGPAESDGSRGMASAAPGDVAR